MRRRFNIAKSFVKTPTISNLVSAAGAIIGEYDPKNPYISTGIAPTPSKIQTGFTQAQRASKVKNVGEVMQYIKDNGLKILDAVNGKRYVKMPNGSVKDIKKLEIELRDIKNKQFGEAMKYFTEREKTLPTEYRDLKMPEYSNYDPATNLEATKGSINTVRGKYSNRNAKTANDF